MQNDLSEQRSDRIVLEIVSIAEQNKNNNVNDVS